MKHLLRCTAILSLTLALRPLSAHAQKHDVQKWEGGVRVGFAMPFRTLPLTSPTLKFGEIVAEGRFNFPSTPFDIGLAIGKYPKAYTFDSPTPPETVPQKQDMVLATVFSDYNFAQGSIINPYVGIGLDFASIIAAAVDASSHYDRPYSPTPGYVPSYDYSNVVDGTRPILLLRAGVEVYHHLRIESSIYIGGRYANGFSLSVGFVVGGRPKKY